MYWHASSSLLEHWFRLYQFSCIFLLSRKWQVWFCVSWYAPLELIFHPLCNHRTLEKYPHWSLVYQSYSHEYSIASISSTRSIRSTQMVFFRNSEVCRWQFHQTFQNGGHPSSQVLMRLQSSMIGHVVEVMHCQNKDRDQRWIAEKFHCHQVA